MANCLTAARLREVVDYNAETGVFLARVNRSFIRAGARLGCMNSAGYDRITIDGRSYLSHRLAWVFVTGEWPPAEIDHINGNHRDNRFTNLRPATRQENCRNTRRQSNNRSGIKGVSFNAQIGRWVATIKAGGPQKWLGSFKSKDEAAQAYAAASSAMHGEFARLG